MTPLDLKCRGHLFGDVACTLDFIDAVTKQSIYKSKYAGSYNVDKVGGLDKTWSEVMGKALDKLIEDVVLDEDLADAVKEHVAQGSAGPNSAAPTQTRPDVNRASLVR